MRVNAPSSSLEMPDAIERQKGGLATNQQLGRPGSGRTTPSAIPRDMSCVRGKVVSGRAYFGLWIERLSSFYEQKTGMRLYPGTLNVELPSPYSLPRVHLDNVGHRYKSKAGR
jgi:hypothetical protein